MAWEWVSEIKNDNTHYFFCVPAYDPNNLNPYNDTNIRLRAQREANSEAGSSANFLSYRTILFDLGAQKSANADIYDGAADGSLDTFLYGKAPGTGLHLTVTRSEYTAAIYRFLYNAVRYLSFTNSATAMSRDQNVGWNSANKYTNAFAGIALAMNTDTEEMYLWAITGNMYWDNSIGSPGYYDNVQVDFFPGYRSGNGNLWNVLKDSIPGGGGSAGPYDDGGTSTPGEQAATWDDTSDVISVPSVPSFSLIINKLIHAWAPSVSDLDSIGTYLWSNFDITDPTKSLSKVFQNPLESILTLHALPFAVSSGQAVRLTLAGFDTGVDLPPLTAQFKDVPCGSITIEPYWDNYLDYNPYTKITLCLPFAGQVTLDPDEVMGKTLSVTYRVDCLTGSFVCFVFIDGDKVLGQYAGNCALSIPISAADYGRFNAAILGVAASAASAFGAVASGGSALGALADVAGSAVQEIQDAKVRVAHSGGLTGAPGFMGVQKPYLIIHRPRQSVPESYGGFKGYPLNVTKTLGECSGFTSVREIHLDGIPLTEPELEELRGILEGGIVI